MPVDAAEYLRHSSTKLAAVPKMVDKDIETNTKKSGRFSAIFRSFLFISRALCQKS